MSIQPEFQSAAPLVAEKRHLLFIGGEDAHLRMPFFLALKARGYRVTSAADCAPGPFEKAGIEFRPISFGRFFSPLRDIKAYGELRRLLRDVDADLAHSFDTKLNVLVGLAAHAHPRTRVVRTINGRGWIFSSRSPAAGALRAVYPLMQRLAAISTHATVFEHSHDYAYFTERKLTGPGEALVIPGAGVDVEGFERARRQGPSPQELRTELGLDGSPVVITVTRVTRQKGILTLLEAARLIHKIRPDVRFLIVGPREGEGPFAVSEEELAACSGFVLAPGARNDVPSLLGMADVFAFPSEYAEGVPRALMEAALCGLPIVTVDAGGCREVVRDGWNGLIAPLRDPAGLAERILRLLDDRALATTMASRGPDLIRGDFCLDSVVAKHAELYERLLSS